MSTYLSVNSSCHEYVTREGNREDPWDRDDTSCDWSFHDVSIVGSNSSFDLIAPFDLKSGDRVWVVLAVYSTGDSFGHDDRACCEYIDVFLDENKALDCVRAIEKTSGSRWDDNTEYASKWVREDGSEGKLDYVPWNGYFESLDFVNCERLEVK